LWIAAQVPAPHHYEHQANNNSCIKVYKCGKVYFEAVNQLAQIKGLKGLKGLEWGVSCQRAALCFQFIKYKVTLHCSVLIQPSSIESIVQSLQFAHLAPLFSSLWLSYRALRPSVFLSRTLSLSSGNRLNPALALDTPNDSRCHNERTTRCQP